MLPINIAVVEDEEVNQQQIQEYIRQYEIDNHENINIVFFENGSHIIKDYKSEFDIILLDIEMPKMDGMETAERIRETDSNVVIIFITNMAQYAISGYSVGALDYVLKPISYYTFEVKLKRAIKRVKTEKPGQVILHLDDGIKLLNTNRIYYIEVQNRVLFYHTQDGDYEVKGTMKQAEEELLPYNFVRCNYWYLVNLSCVDGIKNNKAIVAGNELEISRRNKKNFKDQFMDYIGGKVSS